MKAKLNKVKVPIKKSKKTLPIKKKKTLVPAEKNVDKDLKRLGKRIQQLRIAKGYTSYEYFAYDHEISRTQFGRYERGEDLRYSSLLRVVKALGVSLEQFFGKGF